MTKNKMIICSGATERCGDCIHSKEHLFNQTCNNPYCINMRLTVKCMETFEMIMKKVIKKHEEGYN
jgi:hypothetical protein